MARSSSRPGVPTTMSTPLRSASTCGSYGAAAVDRGDPRRRGACRRRARSRATWTHSSRVGTTTSACGGRRRPRRAVPCRCSSGTPKPRVLPVPVRAWPIRSVPAQRDRQRHLLDGERAGDADGGQRLDGLGVDAEVGERRAVRAHVGAGGQRFELLGVTLRVDVVVLVGGGQCSASLAGADEPALRAIGHTIRIRPGRPRRGRGGTAPRRSRAHMNRDVDRRARRCSFGHAGLAVDLHRDAPTRRPR